MDDSAKPVGGAAMSRRVATRVLGRAGAQRLADFRSDAKGLAHRRLTAKGRKNVEWIQTLRDRHLGEQCVIIGNGPSLNKTDLSLLDDTVTFGLNRLYLMFEKLGFSTTYHAVVNALVVEQCREDFVQLPSPLFSTWPNAPLLAGASEPYFLTPLSGLDFSQDLSRGIWEGATVTYVAMQVAYYMGFKEVVLIGVDHRFTSSGPAHTVVTSVGADPNHFDPNYFGKGFVWQLPDLETSELAYRLAGDAFAARGGQIVDATVDGNLAVFPKVTLKDALGR